MEKYNTTDAVRELVGKASLVEPIAKRHQWTRSRLVLTPDGPISLLLLIAKAKFPSFDPSTQMAFWKDRDYRNESFENVDVVDRVAPSEQSARITKYGVPAGTREYYKRYREANRERLRVQQREYNKANRELIREARERGATGTPAVSASLESRAEAGLADILATIEKTRAAEK